jgi:hypothetical protein
MRHDRLEWARRIKAVEREYSAARLAIYRLLAAAEQASLRLEGELTLRDIRHASERLEGTYLVRLFAEFETGLRLFWSTIKATDPPSRTRDLLDGIAATRHIPHDRLADVHAVREYRNSLVHEREEPTDPVSIAQARNHLNRFFSFLPLQW